MFTNGILTALGVALVLWKLPKWIALRALGRHLWLDAGLTLLIYSLMLGTYSGAVAAAVAGICISIATSALRSTWGYVKADVYYPGWIRMDPDELKRPKPFKLSE